MARDGPSFSDPHFDYEHDILKNLPGFADQKKLDKFERIETAKAILNLQSSPVKGRFDATHIRQIHFRIFKNVFPWAGEFRQVNMRRSSSCGFAVVRFLGKNLDSTFAKLAAENHLKGLDAEAFAGRAAYYLGELNSIHPFREGNGRTHASLFDSWLLRPATASTGFALLASRWLTHLSKVTIW
jgi:cell filamentation protein